MDRLREAITYWDALANGVRGSRADNELGSCYETLVAKAYHTPAVLRPDDLSRLQTAYGRGHNAAKDAAETYLTETIPEQAGELSAADTAVIMDATAWLSTEPVLTALESYMAEGNPAEWEQAYLDSFIELHRDGSGPVTDDSQDVIPADPYQHAYIKQQRAVDQERLPNGDPYQHIYQKD